jgi:uncharacterized protein
MRIYAKVIPKSSKDEVVRISEGEYKIKVTAPPVDGKANVAVIKLLAKHFGVSKNMINIVGGKTSRTKMIDIEK